MPFLDGTKKKRPAGIHACPIKGRNDSTGNPSNTIYMDYGKSTEVVRSSGATNQMADLIAAILAINEAIVTGTTVVWLETANVTTHKYLLSTGGDVAHLRALVAAAAALAGPITVYVELI